MEKATLTLRDKFKKAFKAEKRVMIAKDVLSQIKTKGIKPTEGIYINLGNYLPSFNDILGKQLQDSLGLIKKECPVCAIGAMFLSKCNIGNDHIVDSYSEEDDYSCGRDMLTDDLKKYFSESQLDMIESAFEYEEMGDSGHKKIKKASAFRDNITNGYNTEILLSTIMKNIIKNNGTFKP